MDEIGEKLSAVLNDPEQMRRITDMAKSFMGGEEAAAESYAEAEAFDPGLLQRLMPMLGAAGGRSDKRALIDAMKPYLSEKRRSKVDKAMQLAKLATVAEIALKSFKEDGDV